MRSDGCKAWSREVFDVVAKVRRNCRHLVDRERKSDLAMQFVQPVPNEEMVSQAWNVEGRSPPGVAQACSEFVALSTPVVCDRKKTIVVRRYSTVEGNHTCCKNRHCHSRGVFRCCSEMYRSNAELIDIRCRFPFPKRDGPCRTFI